MLLGSRDAGRGEAAVAAIRQEAPEARAVGASAGTSERTTHNKS